MTFKKDKRGVSDVITTVLIILLVLAAVAIIGGILLRNIGEAGSKIGTQTACIDLDVKPVACAKVIVGPATSNATVLVSRGGRGSDAVIKDLTLLFEDTSSKAVAVVLGSTQFSPVYASDGLKALSTVGYPTLPLPSVLIGTSKYSVRVAATISGADGKTTTCEPSTVKVDCA